MFSKSFTSFCKNNLLNIRELLQKNETLFSSNSTFKTKTIKDNPNKSVENKFSTFLGIPILIPMAIFFIAILICIIIFLLCYYNNRSSSKHKGKKKNKDIKDKCIELSKSKKDENCGHIIISSLD